MHRNMAITNKIGKENCSKHEFKNRVTLNLLIIICVVTIPLAIFLYLVYSPWLVDIQPATFKAQPQRPFRGALTANDKLDHAVKMLKNHIVGPESIAFYQGELYTGLHNGWIVNIKDDKSITPIITVGNPKYEYWDEDRLGRPLGLRFDKHGTLYFADCYNGLYKLNITSRKLTTLFHSSQPVDGKKAMIPNDLDISTSGDVYFSDSSTKFMIKDGLYELLESAPNGRVLHYHAETNTTTTLIDGIAFANGIQLSPKEDYLLVSETFRKRILKYHLKGELTGQVEIFIDNLPGTPDNIRSNGKGGYWVPLCIVQPPNTNDAMTFLGPYAIIRKLVGRNIDKDRSILKFIDYLLPSDFTKILIYKLGHLSTYLKFASPYALVLELNDKGDIIQSLHAPNGHIRHISQVTQHGNSLYFGSPWNGYLAKLNV